MATYFADTSFWIGLSRKRDQHHGRAVAWHQFVIRTKGSILTTEAVLLEWLNAMSDVSTRRIAAESCLRARSDARIEVVPFNAESMLAAIELLRTRSGEHVRRDDMTIDYVLRRRQHAFTYRF